MPAHCPACDSTDLLIGSWWMTCRRCHEQTRIKTGPRSPLSAHPVPRREKREGEAA